MNLWPSTKAPCHDSHGVHGEYDSHVDARDLGSRPRRFGHCDNLGADLAPAASANPDRISDDLGCHGADLAPALPQSVEISEAMAAHRSTSAVTARIKHLRLFEISGHPNLIPKQAPALRRGFSTCCFRGGGGWESSEADRSASGATGADLAPAAAVASRDFGADLAPAATKAAATRG
jgi:hypothetical protein